MKTITITFSGPPKSGKSMIAAYFEKKLKAFGIEVEGEPSDLSPEAQAIRSRELETYLVKGVAPKVKVIIKTRRVGS